MTHTQRSCRERDGQCPISLLCGCVCHVEDGGVPEGPLTVSERAECVLAGSLAALLDLYPGQPYRITKALLDTLERSGLQVSEAT